MPPKPLYRTAVRGRASPFGCTFQLRAHAFAFNLSFRKYSNSEPWKSFVPRFRFTLMMPPWKLPNSAEALFVIIFTSSIASRLTT